MQLTLTESQRRVAATTAIAGAAQGSESPDYQASFIGGYVPSVVGKSIASLSLGRISSSSLTPKGFNAALTTIKAQAKS